ncbi:ATP-binding protein, partial [Vibrio sp. PP-XX7]
LEAMVHDVTEMMRIHAENKNLLLLADLAPSLPRFIVGDEAHLRQVLINLLGNAIKCTKEGGVTLRLGTKSGGHDQLSIEVEDSGIGIAIEDQTRIFEPFEQADALSASRGTGLGLTITSQFVQMMGGSIHLESEIGKGSLFRIDLPLVEASERDISKPEQTHEGEVIGLALGQPEYRILIVEDQYDNQVLLTRLMENAGFKVKLAENGEEGVELFQHWHPHFIWMDIRMAVMDGLEAMRRIRKLPGGGEVKITAVTASAFAEERNQMIHEGMDDYIRKPYRASEIYHCLEKHLGVKYEYHSVDTSQVLEVSLTPDMFESVPTVLCDELTEALESLECERINAVIEQMTSEDAVLGRNLSALADNFNYARILSVLKGTGHGQEIGRALETDEKKTGEEKADEA